MGMISTLLCVINTPRYLKNNFSGLLIGALEKKLDSFQGLAQFHSAPFSPSPSCHTTVYFTPRLMVSNSLGTKNKSF